MFLDWHLSGGGGREDLGLCMSLLCLFWVWLGLVFTSDLKVALQKLLVEDRADLRQLFWWAFYGIINTERDTGEIQMMNMLFDQLGFLCLWGDNSMKCKQRWGADADCLSAAQGAVSGWKHGGFNLRQHFNLPFCPIRTRCLSKGEQYIGSLSPCPSLCRVHRGPVTPLGCAASP